MLYRYISYSEERHRTFSNLKKMYLSIDEHEDCIYIYKRLEQLFGVHTFQDICAWCLYSTGYLCGWVSIKDQISVMSGICGNISAHHEGSEINNGYIIVFILFFNIDNKRNKRKIHIFYTLSLDHICIELQAIELFIKINFKKSRNVFCLNVLPL